MNKKDEHTRTTASGLPNSSCSFHTRKNNWLQQQVQETETSNGWNHIFKLHRDEVHPEGGHETFCRFGSLTGVHQARVSYLLPRHFFGSGDTFGADRADKRNVHRKKTAADVIPVSLLSGVLSGTICTIRLCQNSPQHNQFFFMGSTL